jgi:hypothetical protein
MVWLGPARVWLFIAAVAALSAEIWAPILAHGGPPAAGGISIRWWELAAAFYLAEVFVVHLQFRKQAHTMSLTEIGLVLGLFFASPANLLAAQVAGAAVALSLHRRQRPIKLAFTSRRCRSAPASRCSSSARFRTDGPESVQTWAVVLLAVAVAPRSGWARLRRDRGRRGEVRGAAAAPGRSACRSSGRSRRPASASQGAADRLPTVRRAAAGGPRGRLLWRVHGVHGAAEQREHLEFLYESMRETQGRAGVRARDRTLRIARSTARVSIVAITSPSRTAWPPIGGGISHCGSGMLTL